MRNRDTASLNILLVLMISVLCAVSAQAATFTIANINDGGTGSLRQAILDANVNNEDDDIVFDPTVFSTAQTITLTSGELYLAGDNASGNVKTLTITGTGADLLTISGNNQSRIFYIEGAAIIRALKMTGGNGNGARAELGGGAIMAFAASAVTVSGCEISGNSSPVYGGGIAHFVGSRMIVINSTIANNTANGGGGGIINEGDFLMLNSTVSGNTTNSIGGGILNGFTYSLSRMNLVNCTIAFNRGLGNQYDVSTGGGIYSLNNGTFYYSVSLLNTIVAKNTVNSDSRAPDFAGLLISEGSNLLGNSLGTAIVGVTTGNQLDVDPQLDPFLRLNGGAVSTIALRVGSPATERGNNCVLLAAKNGGCLDQPLTTDERGFARASDGDGNGIDTVDLGAFEIQPTETASAPSRPDLLPVSDTGTSTTDNITRSRTLSFNVPFVTSGATVQLMREGIVVASSVATGNTAAVTDNNAPADGIFQYSARQIVGNQTSLQSLALNVTIDNTAPTVTINQNTSQADPTGTQPIGYFIVFSESVTGFGAEDVSLVGSTANVSAATLQTLGGTAYYGVLVSNVTVGGTVRADVTANAVQDIAGNPSVASTSTDNTVTLDLTPPTVTINQASGQPDPARYSPLAFTVIFSEPVTGLTSSDISLAGSSANVSSASVTVIGTGTTYTVLVGNVVANDQTIQASIPVNAAQDAVGNLSLASTSTDNVVTLDNVPPTVTIDQAPGQIDPASSQPINFRVVFSENVFGFGRSSISLLGSTANVSTANIVVTGSGRIYNVAVSNVTASGIVLARVLGFTVSDAAGNPNSASTSGDNTVTVTIPATANLAGRVTAGAGTSGRGLPNARVVLTDPNGETRFAMTNPFGYFRFLGVATGSVTIAVSRKNSQPAVQSFFLTNDVSDLSFTLP